MNLIKTKKRNQLKPENLDMLVRSRMNLPKDLEKFNSYEIAEKFVKKHRRIVSINQTEKVIEIFIFDSSLRYQCIHVAGWQEAGR